LPRGIYKNQNLIVIFTGTIPV